MNPPDGPKLQIEIYIPGIRNWREASFPLFFTPLLLVHTSPGGHSFSSLSDDLITRVGYLIILFLFCGVVGNYDSVEARRMKEKRRNTDCCRIFN